MMRIMTLALAAVVAVLAFSAIAVSTASALEHPLFLTQSGRTLLFTGESVKPILRGEEALKNPVTVECEKALVHGFILHKSTLAHVLPIIFEGKCVQKINGGVNEACNEPIETKRILSELGLLSVTAHHVVILLAPSDGTTTFAEFTCGLQKTTVKGAIVAEIPETNSRNEPQYEVFRTELEVVFATVNKNNHQAITEIYLLGTQMKGAELRAEGFFSGTAPAAEEAIGTLKGDGQVRIDLFE